MQIQQLNNNPLLNMENDLPAFDLIKPQHILPAINHLLQQANNAVASVAKPDFPADWLAISKVLDVACEKLSRAWGVINHLNSVLNSQQLREEYNQALPLVNEFWTKLGTNQALFNKYQAINSEQLNDEQQQALNNSLRSFRLNGVNLSEQPKQQFIEISKQLAQLEQKFSENILDATDAFCYYASEQEIDGLPEDFKQQARQLAEQDQQPGYKITLHFPSYFPVMQYANSAKLREKLYHANLTRASEIDSYNANKFDNTAIINKILQLRQQQAKLLGFNNYAELSLATKMAQSPQQVEQFLLELSTKAKPFAQADVKQLRDFAKQQLNIDDPQPFDWNFISEQLKQQQYGFDEQQVRQYFQLPKVLNGLFALVEKLYQIKIQADTTSVWHPDVSFYKITRNGELIGQFYLDPFARAGKRSGAWMDDARSRWLRPDTNSLQTPVAYLVCNFTAPVGNQSALLTHDEVTTLFHEFGHGLHHLLTKVNEREVSGINGVEWDAVEQPSQFMENFCWEWSVLSKLTAHQQNGEQLPKELFDKMLASKNFQSGMQTQRQLEFALFDFYIHQNQQVNYQQQLQQVRQIVAVLPTASYNRFANSFSHIFAGGYAAGYYSYKWAELLSSDIYAAFEETKLNNDEFDPNTSNKYLAEILSYGGARSALDSFVAFRGRQPQIDAMLRHQGLTNINN